MWWSLYISKVKTECIWNIYDLLLNKISVDSMKALKALFTPKIQFIYSLFLTVYELQNRQEDILKNADKKRWMEYYYITNNSKIVRIVI